MGRVVLAEQISLSGVDVRRLRQIMLLLSVCLALLMTGYGIILPIFARRLGEMGSGVRELSLMSTAYALATIVTAPIMGALADRFGRRPMVLGSLLSFALANIGFLLAESTEMLVLMRALEGGLSAGLFPAAQGIVVDLAPKEQRARWLGIVMGGASVGWIVGPLAGGLLYDAWGFEAPFLASAGVGLLACFAAAVLVPETRTRAVRRRELLQGRRAADLATEPPRRESFWSTLPRPVPTFLVLLSISFVTYFAWAFFEPQFIFYIYDDLNWTSTDFGFASVGYGVATALGLSTLGPVGDRIGRVPSIVSGLFFFSAQFAGLIVSSSVWLVTISFAVAGLGEGLMRPALNAFIMDITDERHRARVMGYRSSAGSLGGVLGPLLAAAIAGVVAPRHTFVGSLLFVLLCSLLALAVLREPRQIAETTVTPGEAPLGRVLAARATLRGIISSASAVRQHKNPP
jgi:DHA1 family tetracycline resistance protein-like MFS transporter